MQPILVITGILLGTTFAIAVGLLVVALIFLLLGDKYPDLRTEFWPLIKITALFVGMTALCAISFFGQARQRPWRWIAQVAMWTGLAFVAFYFWPD